MEMMGIALTIPAAAFWPYFAGATILAFGATVLLQKGLRQAHGLDNIVSFGRLFFAIPMAVFGAQHFISARFIVKLIPAWIPGPLFWTYFVGVALIAAALSIVASQQSRLAATMLGVMLFLFVVLMYMPSLLHDPSDRNQLASVFRNLCFSGGAFALAGVQTENWRRHGTNWIVTLARFFIAASVIFFGVENILHPEFVPTVPFNKLTPSWIPGHSLWGYPTGLIFVVAGLSLVLNKKPRLAAIWLGMVVLLLVLFVYLPIVIAEPSDVANGLDYFVDTLGLSGAALLLAGALREPEVEGITASRLRSLRTAFGISSTEVLPNPKINP